MPIENPPGPQERNIDADRPRDASLSLSRLREAFAAMLGEGDRGSSVEGGGPDEGRKEPDAGPVHCEINPRSVAEAMLFVGRPDNGPLSARELAAAVQSSTFMLVGHVSVSLGFLTIPNKTTPGPPLPRSAERQH